MNDFQYKQLHCMRSDLKTALCEAFDFDGDEDLDGIGAAAEKISIDAAHKKLRDTLMDSIESNNPDWIAQEARRVREMCSDSTVVVDGKSIPSLLYKHQVLTGRDFLIPGYFSGVNFGRKNDKSAKYRGDVHYKDVPKPLLKYYQYIDSQKNFGAVKVSVKCNMIAAIDDSKRNNPNYPDNKGAQWDIWLAPEK